MFEAVALAVALRASELLLYAERAFMLLESLYCDSVELLKV